MALSAKLMGQNLTSGEFNSQIERQRQFTLKSLHQNFKQKTDNESMREAERELLELARKEGGHGEESKRDSQGSTFHFLKPQLAKHGATVLETGSSNAREFE